MSQHNDATSPNYGLFIRLRGNFMLPRNKIFVITNSSFINILFFCSTEDRSDVLRRRIFGVPTTFDNANRKN
jgi:hypothetical protein